MDNWTIVNGAKDPVAAHTWINYVLDPVAGKERYYHGYKVPVTGAEGVDPKMAKDPMIDIPQDKIAGYRRRSRRPELSAPRRRTTPSSSRDMAAAEAISRPTAEPRRRGVGARLGRAAGGRARRGLFTQFGTIGPGSCRPWRCCWSRCPCSWSAALRSARLDAVAGREPPAYPLAARVPSLAYYAAFFLIPLGFLLLFAVSTSLGFGEVQYGLDLGNFSAALDSLYIDVFLRTLRDGGVGTLLIILVGYPLAYWIARYAPANRREPVPGAGHHAVLDVVPDPDVLVPDRPLAGVLPVGLAAVARPDERPARTSSTR